MQRQCPRLLAAAVTPLRDGGSRLDLAAIPEYSAYLEASGVDGVFVCGTTGEGVLLGITERRAVAEAYRTAVSGQLIVHAGAQTTADTVALAAHAAEIGADAVAVIAPPYFSLDDAALTAHMVAAARACAPVPFYLYAFSARSGYPISLEVVERIRGEVDNLAGLKVSEATLEDVERYIATGLPVYVGSEPLIPEALLIGAIGSVSGMAAALPEVVRAAIDVPDGECGHRLRELRNALEASGQFIAAVKHLLGRRGIPVCDEVRPPLRRLTGPEEAALDAALDKLGLESI